jgi:NAD(P)-dependent dehydrogenase (short-subunit alcohol dehydrogenase family)
LAGLGWRLVLTARGARRLEQVAAELPHPVSVTTVAGDVADPEHRARLVGHINQIGLLDLLVNNASTLGPTPLRPLAALSPTELSSVLAVNVVAPFALTAALLPALSAAGGIVLDISSDAAAEHYPDWGGYGASKAALDHLTLTFGVENLAIACYAVDPGDMRTDMQQAAFPGEDISDRRPPSAVVPALLDLIQSRPPSGRYRAADIAGRRAVGVAVTA